MCYKKRRLLLNTSLYQGCYDRESVDVLWEVKRKRMNVVWCRSSRFDELVSTVVDVLRSDMDFSQFCS